jgi:hypothetical protein
MDPPERKRHFHFLLVLVSGIGELEDLRQDCHFPENPPPGLEGS